MDGKLNKEQLDNWRKMIPVLFGIPGTFLSDGQVQKLRDKMQKIMDESPRPGEKREVVV